MRITKIASSTVIIEFNDIKILSDPWIEDGEYYGSWCLMQDIDKEKAYLHMNSCDYIFLSHIHPDHMSKKTLKNINKNIKIIIHKFASPYVKKNLDALGFKNVIELNHGEIFKLNNNVKIEIYAADDCNPKICKKIMGCNYDTDQIGKNSHQIDTCSLVYDQKHKVLNLNDCHVNLMENTISRIVAKHKSIDYLLINYSSAHSYPQCIENLSIQKKIEESNKLKNLSFKYSEKYLQLVKPKYFIPFTGEYYIGGKFSDYNNYYGVNNQNECFEYFSKSKFKNQLLMINYGNSFTEGYKNNFKILSKNKIEKKRLNISRIKYDYENDVYPDKESIIDKLEKASNNLYSKMKIMNIKFNENIAIKFFNNYFKLDLYNLTNKVYENKKGLLNEKITILKLDERLLAKILLGPRYAHWNNADIGSHIIYEKINILNYNYKLFNTISYFHN